MSRRDGNLAQALARTLAAAALALAAQPACAQDATGMFLRGEGKAGLLEFEKPSLRIYDDHGQRTLTVDGEKAVSRQGAHRVFAVRFHANLQPAAAVKPGDDEGAGAALRYLQGQADQARFEAETETILFEGNVMLHLHSRRPTPIAGGAVGQAPAATLRLDRLRYNPKRKLVTSTGRVWSLLRDGTASSEISGLGMQFDLNAKALAIGSDVRFLVGGDLLSAKSLLRVRPSRRSGAPGGGTSRGQRSARKRLYGAVITAQSGVRLTGLGRLSVEATRAGGDAADSTPPLAPAQRILFRGPVRVTQENLTLACDELELLAEQDRLSRVRAFGHVRIRAIQPDPDRPGSILEEIIAEGRAARWDLPAGAQGDEQRLGTLSLMGTQDDPAELVRHSATRPSGQLVAPTIHVDLHSGKVTTRETSP